MPHAHTLPQHPVILAALRRAAAFLAGLLLVRLTHEIQFGTLDGCFHLVGRVVILPLAFTRAVKPYCSVFGLKDFALSNFSDCIMCFVYS